MNIDQQNKAWNVLPKETRQQYRDIFRFRYKDKEIRDLLCDLFGERNLKYHSVDQELLVADKKEILTLCQDNRDNIIGSTLRNIFGEQLEDNGSHEEETAPVQEEVQSMKKEIFNKIPATDTDDAAAKFWVPEIGQKVRLISDPSIVDTVKNIYDAKSPAGTLVELSDGSLLWSSGIQPYVQPIFKLNELVIAPNENNEVYTISSIHYNGQDKIYYYEVYELEMASFKESQLKAYPDGLEAPKYRRGQMMEQKVSPTDENSPVEIMDIFIQYRIGGRPTVFYRTCNKNNQIEGVYCEDSIKPYIKPLVPGDEVLMNGRFLKVDKVWHQENVGVLFTIQGDPHVYNETGLLEKYTLR